MGSRLFLSFLPSKPMTLALRQESPAAPGRQEVPTGRGGQRGVWGGGAGFDSCQSQCDLALPLKILRG